MSQSIGRIELEYHASAAKILGRHMEKAYPPEEVLDPEDDERVVMHASEILRTLGSDTAAAYIVNATTKQHAEHEREGE